MGKGNGVTEGVVDVSLSSKVHDGIDLFLLQDEVDKVGRGDITLDEPVVREVRNLIQVLQTTTVIQPVIDKDVVLGVLLTQQDGNVGCDETWGGSVTFRRMAEREKRTTEKEVGVRIQIDQYGKDCLVGIELNVEPCIVVGISRRRCRMIEQIMR